jgi:uncharacterized protein YndB with AHSA1/START domain
MIELELDQKIKAPIEKVFAYVTDFRQATQWQDGVSESSQTPDGPTQLGTRFSTVRTFLGQRIEATGEVTEFVPSQKCAFRSASGPMQFSMRQTFETAGSETKVHLHVEIEGSGIFKVAEHALKNNLTKEFERQAQRLKNLLET